MQKLSQKFKIILFWLVLTLFLFIPLYQKFPLFEISKTFVSIRLEDFLILITFIIWGVYILISGDFKKLLYDNLTKLIALFVSLGLLSLFSAAYLTHTIGLSLGLLHLLRRIEMIGLLLVGIWAVGGKRQLKVLLITASIALFLVNFYAVGQKYFSFPAISTTNSELSKGKIFYLGQFDRVNSTFAGHYDLAIFLMMSIILTLSIFLFKVDTFKTEFVRKIDKIFPFLWLGVLIIFSMLILILTAARLSFAACVFGIIVLFIILKKWKYIVFSLILFALLLAYPSQLRNRLISTITINIGGQWSSYVAVNEEQAKRSLLNIPTLPAMGKKTPTQGAQAADIAPGEPIDTTDLAIYRSFEIRTKVEWPRAIRALTRNPFLGSGYSSIGLATDNDLLRLLGEVGIMGTVAFILIIWEITKRLISLYRNSSGFFRYYYAGIIAMLISFILNSLFIDVFEASKVASIFWLVLGISLGAAKIKK
jgi:hypothetical protein